MSSYFYTNKTVYTKEFHKQVALFNLFHSSYILTLPVVVSVLAFVIYAFTIGKLQLIELIFLLAIGGVLYPLAFFILPYSSILKRYKVNRDKYNRDLVSELSLSTTGISYKDNNKNSFFRNFKDTVRLIKNDKIVVLVYKNETSLYIDPNGFGEQLDDAINFICKYTNLKVKKF